MSLPEKSPKLKTTFKIIHSSFQSGMNSLVIEVQELKDKVDTLFSDFSQQCIDVEDRLKDVLKEKKTILTEYEILLRKDKEGCQKCFQLEAKLNKDSKKLKQYEMKMKNIANLLYVNTMNTEANLVSHMGAKLSQESVPVKVKDQVVSSEQKTTGSPEKQTSDVKMESESGSKILVHEQDDEIYFETTLKRKTPDCADTVMDIPETICEDFTYFDSAKRPQQGDNAEQHETPSKKRKLSQRSPRADRNQQSPGAMRAENQTPTPASPLRTRNRLVATREKKLGLVDASPSLISKPKLRSRTGTQEKASSQETQSAGKAKKNLSRDSNEEKAGSQRMSVEYELDDNQEMLEEESKENSPCDETRFPLFEEVKKAARSGEHKTNSNECKATTSQTKNRKLNGSRIWENIEFSDDSDDFIDTNRKVSSQKKDSSFSFAKPSAADSSKNKWNLKLVNSSINKSKLKQTRLTLEKKVSKIDITEVEGYAGGVMPSDNAAKETREEPKKFIIEETQELEDDADDEEEIIDTTRKRRSKNKRDSQATSSPDHSDSIGSIRVRSLQTLLDESTFMPNAVSTQKSKNQNKNSNNCKLSSQLVCKRKTYVATSPKKALSPSPNKNRSPCKANCTPKCGIKTPSAGSNGKLGVSCNSTANAGAGLKKPLFLPKESKTEVDYSPQWTCPGCIDYFIDGYGRDILKVRPPPKKCGHNNKYPATPPDFWDPMCS